MGSITSGVGLVSGLPIADIIDSLIEVEGRSKNLVEANIVEMQAKQAGYDILNSTIAELQAISTGFNSRLLNTRTVNSSNSNVLTASAGSQTPPGSYSFVVKNLVSTQQGLSKGFSERDTALGTATTLSFNDARADFETNTELSQLNGGQGVERGLIYVRDQSGAAAVVDLSKAISVNDVLDEINNNTNINVLASVEGDQLKLTDTSGSSSTTLTVTEVGNGTTAAGLGLTSLSQSGTEYTGTDINNLSGNLNLLDINDGLGIRRSSSQDDFSITSGALSFNVDIADAETVQDVLDLINNDASNTGADAVTASVSGNGIQLTNTSAGAISVAALNSSNAAEDLGILNASGSGTATGDDILASVNSSLIRNASTGASGTSLTLGTIDVNGTGIDLSSASSISDAIDLINNETGTTNVTASIDENTGQLKLTENSGGTLTVSDTTGNTATYLGIAVTGASSPAVGSAFKQYISEETKLSSLNGGTGVNKSSIRLTDANGTSATINIGDDDTTIKDVISEINAMGLALTARINDDGSGIAIDDTSGGGGLSIQVEESGGNTARDLNILGTASGAGASIDGSFNRTVDIEATDSLDDIAQKINDADIDITASILNDGSGTNPYRLNLASDNAGSSGGFLFNEGDLDLDFNNVQEAQDAVVFLGNSAADGLLIRSSTNSLDNVAAGLNISLLSASDTPTTVTVNKDNAPVIDQLSRFVEQFNLVVGTIDELDRFDPDTLERGILLGESTLLNVENRLFSSVTAQVQVDSQFTLFSQIGVTLGRGGNLSFDAAKFNEAYAENPDAVENLLTFTPDISSSTDFEEMRIGGAELTTQDGNDIKFTDKDGTEYEFNIDAFGSISSFLNALELTTGGDITGEIDGRRLKFTDNTSGSGNFIIEDLGVSRIAGELGIEGTYTGTSVTSTLITIDSNNSQKGLGGRITGVLSSFTDQFTGIITQANNTLQDQIDLANDRVDDLQDALDAKRERLTAEFTAMELAIANIQSQQSALLQLSAG